MQSPQKWGDSCRAKKKWRTLYRVSVCVTTRVATEVEFFLLKHFLNDGAP